MPSLKSQARDHSCPAPGSRPQVQDFDLQYVSRYGAFHEYWAAKGVQLVEVKLGQLGGGVTLLDLSGCDLFSFEMNDVAWLDHYRRSVGLIPLVMDLGLANVVLTELCLRHLTSSSQIKRWKLRQV